MPDALPSAPVPTSYSRRGERDRSDGPADKDDVLGGLSEPFRTADYRSTRAARRESPPSLNALVEQTRPDDPPSDQYLPFGQLGEAGQRRKVVARHIGAQHELSVPGSNAADRSRRAREEVGVLCVQHQRTREPQPAAHGRQIAPRTRAAVDLASHAYGSQESLHDTDGLE